MQRRSFFGVVFGGFLAWGTSPRPVSWTRIWRHRGYWPDDPQYQFGFTGFKPATGAGDTEVERWVAQKQLERDLGQDLIRTYAPGQRRLQQYMPPGGVLRP